MNGPQADRDGNGHLDKTEFTKLWLALKQEGPVGNLKFKLLFSYYFFQAREASWLVEILFFTYFNFVFKQEGSVCNLNFKLFFTFFNFFSSKGAGAFLKVVCFELNPKQRLISCHIQAILVLVEIE